MYLVLSDADRERLGAPERMELDLGSITNREAIQLRTLGFRTPHLFRRALRSTAIDADGNVLSGDDAKFESAGGKAVDIEVDYNAWTVLVWLALKRAGVDTDARSLEFAIDEVRLLAEPEPEQVEDPKAEPPAEGPEDSTS